MVHKSRVARKVSDYSKCGASVLNEPLVKKVRWLPKALGNVTHQLYTKFVHRFIVIYHKFFELIGSRRILRPGRNFMQRKLSLVLTDFRPLKSNLIEFLVGWIVIYEWGEPSVQIRICLLEMVFLQLLLDLVTL